MNWQQKADALNSLCELDVKIRKAGDWYVSQRTDIGGDGFLRGAYGNGETPEAAIEDHWRQLVTELPPDKYIAVDALGDERKHWRWNGYMWREIPGPKENAA